MGSRPFTTNQVPRNFNEATSVREDKPNFNGVGTQNFTSPQNGSFSTYSSNIPHGPLNYQSRLERVLSDFDSHLKKRLSSLGVKLKQQQDEAISKINTLWRVISDKFDNAPTRDMAKNSIANINVVNSSSPKCIHFVNTITIIRKEDEPKEAKPLKLDSNGRRLDRNNENPIDKESRASKIVIDEEELSNHGINDDEGHDLLSSKVILSKDDYSRRCERASDLQSEFYRDIDKLGPPYKEEIERIDLDVAFEAGGSRRSDECVT
nr:hypothetical protein [Tanacetum cinerariifolium]